MPQTERKCGWKYCKHEPSEISEGSSVKVGPKWYHEDCAKISAAMVEIRDLYYEEVDRAVVMKQLVRAIKQLLIDKSVDPDFCVFALKYAIKNELPIRSPYGLSYLVTNYRIKEAWKRYTVRIKARQVSEESLPTEWAPPVVNDNSFKYEQAAHGFGSIFGSEVDKQ